MSKKDNLIDLKSRPPAERKKIATMGGKASGRAKRHKKDLKKLAELILAGEVTGDYAQQLSSIGAPPTIGGKLLLEVINTAGSNPKHFELLLKLLGYNLQDGSIHKDETIQIYLPDNGRD